MNAKLSIIIPAYNEEKRILPTLKDYYGFLSKKLKSNFEMIIVPNNCSDKTLEICKKFSDRKKQIKIFNIPGKVGKGGAVIKGFTNANGEFIGFTDADGSIDAENFFKLYKNIKNNDGVIGSRRAKGAKVRGRKLSERISSYLFNITIRIFVGLKFKDTQCGAKIFTRRAANLITKNISETGWIFDVDMLNICKNKRLKIKEIPIIWIGKEGTKLKFKDKISSLNKLLIYSIRKGESTKQFLKFGIIGTLNTLINLAVLYVLTSVFGLYYMLSAVLAFLIANLNSFLWNKKWTFREKIKHRFTIKYIKFLSISLVSLFVNLAFLYIFTEFFKVYYLVSQIIAIGISLIINFLGNKRWTFIR